MAPQDTVAAETATTPTTAPTAGTETAGANVKAKGSRRLGGRKDRTGCITCKIRRVKCDEDKPACKRCTSTGRKCDGYAPAAAVVSRQKGQAQQVQEVGQAQRTQKVALQPLNGARASNNTPLCIRPRQFVGDGLSVANQQEHLAFQFFAQTGALSLAGCNDVDFWTRMVPQCAQADAAIYHASVAVGALLMRHSTKSTTSTSTSACLTTLAIERQNRAIQSTVRGMVSPIRRPADADATTFILLFCIEALQGREVEALQLFQHGIQALAQQETQQSKQSTRSSRNTALAAQLDRIRLQCGMFNAGSATSSSPARTEALTKLLASPPATPFASLEAARDEMSDLITAVQVIVAARWIDMDGDTDREASRARNAVQTRALEAALNGWRVRFSDHIASSHHTGMDTVMASLLRLRYLVARIWMADAPGQSELAYDNYEEVFADIADEADRCLGGGRLGSVPFTFEMGLIPPLYWALLKCRRPQLRRRLLALLREAPAQEGLWSRDVSVQVAERVIAFEEGVSGELSQHSLPYQGGLDLLPAESQRIKIVRINLRTTLDDGRQGDHVECFGMPFGMEGGLRPVLQFFAVAE